jgi:hypothetical protein
MLPESNARDGNPCCQNATTKRKPLEDFFSNSRIAPFFGAGSAESGRDAGCAGSENRLTVGIIRAFCLLALIFGIIPARSAEANPEPRTVTEDFEGETTLARYGEDLARFVRSHVRTQQDARSGESCEQLVFQAPQIVPDQKVAIDVSESRVFDELTASMWVRSNCQTLRLGVRVRFPHQIDPRTGEPLAVDVVGDQYTQPREWQRLKCRTTEERVASRLYRLRAQLAESLGTTAPDLREMYVDQVIVLFQLPQGPSALLIDDLEFGPIVPPTTLPAKEEEAVRSEPVLRIVDDRILKRGEPFFPLLTLYHGESLDAVASVGVNTLWIPDYQNKPLLAALKEMDLGAVAQPPQQSLEEAVLKRSGIPTFPDWTAPVWAWILGYDVPAEDQQYVTAWSDQVRDADRQLQRPILVDVAGNERSIHRKIDLLGSSDFTLHTSLTPLDHFEHLRRRRDLALPGKPMFTFIQTEVSEPLLEYLTEAGRLSPGLQTPAVPVVEPEQILHQGYAALAAGYKGIGFWKQFPLESARPGLDERLHALRIFSAHCRILEPWIASAEANSEIPVQTEEGSSRSKAVRSSPLSSRWDVVLDDGTGHPARLRNSQGIRARVLRSERGLLILPVWYEEGGQCVPGPQAAPEIWMLLRGFDEPQAWEVTPTGIHSSNLTLTPVAGGTEIRVKDFSRQSVIVVTRDASAVEDLNRRCRKYREQAAEAYVALAELKHDRVREVHERLQLTAPEVPHAGPRLRRAKWRVDEAKRELAKGHYDDARRMSEAALQDLRAFQRAAWEAAVDPLPAATTSLLAANFQTLPDHWKLLEEMGRSAGLSRNLLPSGSFEEEQALLSSWRDGSHADARTRLQLSPGGVAGRSCLSMSVQSGSPHPLVLISPEVPVQRGDLLVISGHVRFAGAPEQTGSPSVRPASRESVPPVGGELLIFDSFAGRSGAVRFPYGEWASRTGSPPPTAERNWRPFKLIRHATGNDPLRLWIELHGHGAAHLDDIRVHTLSTYQE